MANKLITTVIPLFCGIIFLNYGYYCFITDGISQGNYGLIGIPIGLGIILGFLFAILGDSEK